MQTLRVLTGIKPSGTPHLGNYVGAIRPALRSSALGSVDAFYFLADYHALISTHEPERVQRSTLEIAATWLACGLDPERVTFYRQSDIPETTELTWLLTCVCGKGLLNRAHAYKAALDKNAASGVEPDDGVSAGLFMYPVLMAADILLFNAHQVPVGATRCSTSKWRATSLPASTTSTARTSPCPRPWSRPKWPPCPGSMGAR